MFKINGYKNKIENALKNNVPLNFTKYYNEGHIDLNKIIKYYKKQKQHNFFERLFEFEEIKNSELVYILHIALEEKRL